MTFYAVITSAKNNILTKLKYKSIENMILHVPVARSERM